MGKYLFQVSYTAQGAKGLLEGGGGERRPSRPPKVSAARSSPSTSPSATPMPSSSLPDHASASAISLAVSASGGAYCKTIVLMTPDEVDQASKKPLTYTGPGR